MTTVFSPPLPAASNGRAPLPPIVCAIDDGYATPLQALMRSLAAAHPDAVGELHLLVVHHRLSQGSRTALTRVADELGLPIRLVAADGITAPGPVSGWVSPAVYLRLQLAELLDLDGVILYLDADVLAVADLRPLLRRPLHGAALAAVRDPRNPLVGGGIALPGWRRLGVPAGRDYFNSGVMLMDLGQCRRTGLFERAARFLADFPDEVRLWDQDALNVAADDQWLRLDRRWNTFVLSPLVDQPGFVHTDTEPVMPLAQLLDDEHTAAVLHFAGSDKPWLPGYPAGPALQRYRSFLLATSEASR
ncbi:glycosyltransferase family 8 protein [Micromonospora sp. LOL_021]|uniref:glycosyltransferase family 8 protein n=1 Tax=Micromonospora sp. LOL_021 TaxID=3345417 RepID=UPI003A86E69C